MAVTIKDIAKKAGVSYATVSRALNNRPEVNEKTRREIQKLAEEMGYKPNALARSLVTRESKTLGLIIPDITNPFFPEVARGVEEAAAQAGYSVFLCNTNWEEEKERKYLALLEEKRVDGIILASVIQDGQQMIEHIASSNVPLIMINRILKNVNTHYVVIDNVRGACLVMEHLIENGHRDIAFIGGLSHVEATQERLQGYKMMLGAYDLPVRPELIRLGSFKRESGYQNALELLRLSPRPTAIFAANDILALGVLQAAADLHLQVPGDLAVVGFDDIPFASYTEVSLTTVAQPKYAMGEMAAKILIEEIKEGPSREKKKIVLQPELIIRRSSQSL
ncbi:LacI family DNA-binding transcriptional regulator [Desulfurispora thermophila]|uniref:LacI family DNA-binding transcriptional regulator n=1 Tax=Desulfurispora thermophila TaxID=265470 RepID=UPI000371BE90|nr:LacI family DNA-binding transcriptional regulator [Desulfurispora thermophila]